MRSLPAERSTKSTKRKLDPKTANILYHDAAARSYDDKWSISFDERCVAYVRDRAIPYNPLHDRGFLSIGCAPCTRATAPGEPERAGRWWWEQEGHKECGLHSHRPVPARCASE